MRTRNTSLLLAVVFCSMVNAADDGKTTDLTQVKRGLAVSEKLTFPTMDGIRTWQQHSDSNGKGVSVDADQWMLTRVANLWSDKCENHDLANVGIISDGGRSIRIIDMRMIRNGERKDVPVKRGDIVIFLLPEQVE